MEHENTNNIYQYCNSDCLKNCNCAYQLENGEKVKQTFCWGWSSDPLFKSANCVLSKNGRLVRFHGLFSEGTSCIVGNMAFQPGFHYYWEIEIRTPLFGTSTVSITRPSRSFTSLHAARKYCNRHVS